MDKVRFQKLLHQTFWVPFGIAGILAATLLLEVQFLMNRARLVEHTDQVITLSQRIYRLRIDQESALRGYVLTGDRRFLEPLYQERKRALALEPQLRELVSDKPEQIARNEKSFQAFQAWSAWADEAITMTKAGEDAGEVRFQLRGKELMDQYREAREEFLEREQQLRDERLARSRRALDFVNASIVALCILFGIGFAVVGRKQLKSLSESFNEALNTAERNAAEVKAQKEWLHTMLNSIGDAVIATDADGAITLMNPVAQNLTEWTLEEAKGKPLTDVFRILNQQTRETVESPVDKVRRLKRVVGLANHTILVNKSGQEIAIDDSGAPILGPDGAITGIVLIFRDVTRQRALEAALQSNERLALAGRLSASIAHEVHNPLDTVGNVLYLLSKQMNPRPEIQRLITTAQSEVQRVTEISKNMLSLHHESRTASPIKLSEFLEGVVSLIEETIVKGRRDIQLEHGYEGQIEGFPSELRQVFTNVIKNAVEATTEAGQIRIVSEPTHESGRGEVVVHVVDNGAGIPEQVRSKLFGPFASTKEESGTGLGLWVSRSIVEKHGGTIRVSSGANRRGTTVSIFLPLEASSRKKSTGTASAAHGDGG